MNHQDTIVALSTPTGIGAIGLIRLSGPKALDILNTVFKGKKLEDQTSHTLHFGRIMNGDQILDEVVVGIFKGPNSYTGQDVLEISCHGSNYIIQTILKLLVEKGARPAEPGEYTLRAFLHGKMDLSQSEAVSDLIASETQAMHQVAINQMRGGFRSELEKIRQELLDFASLIELELDFSEEDVEFADRTRLIKVLERLIEEIKPLIESFHLGNALKKGVPVVIAGKPNAGKSTLLNALVGEERAIVSQIPGTTRDTIEVEINLEGILFRFIDTAGIRESMDEIETLGIKKTQKEIEKASILLYIFDPIEMNEDQLNPILEEIQKNSPQIKIIPVANKSDLIPINTIPQYSLPISAKEKHNLNGLKEALLTQVDRERLISGSTIITNARHLDALNKTLQAVQATLQMAHSPNSGELLAFEIKDALYHLGTITGQVSNDELLGNIFGKFCIGK